MREAPDTAADTLMTVKCELVGEVLRSFGALRCTSIGWSMLPTVFPGDTLMIERVSPDQVRVGDVVVAGREGRLCAHRVIGTKSDPKYLQWITQGDAVSRPDRPVLENELLGRVTYLIRAGRLIALPTKLGLLERFVANLVRRSTPAARALVYLHRTLQTPEALIPREDFLCQD